MEKHCTSFKQSKAKSDLSMRRYENLKLKILFCFVVYFILSRLLYLAFSANLGLLCMPHPGMGPLV